MRRHIQNRPLTFSNSATMVGNRPAPPTGYWPLLRRPLLHLNRAGRLALTPSLAFISAVGILATRRVGLVAIRSALRDAFSILGRGLGHIHCERNQSGRRHHKSKNKTDWSDHVALR